MKTVLLAIMATLLCSCATLRTNHFAGYDIPEYIDATAFDTADVVFSGVLIGIKPNQAYDSGVYERTVCLDFAITPDGICRGKELLNGQDKISVLCPAQSMSTPLRLGRRYLMPADVVGSLLIAVSDKGTLVAVSR